MTATRVLATSIIASIFAVCAAAQNNRVTLTDADRQAAKTARKGNIHPEPAQTPAAGKLAKETASKAARPADPPTLLPGPGPRYPGDLSYLGGQVVVDAQFHAIYVLNNFTGTTGCTETTVASCWGNPEGFLKDLGKSDFIHVADQYVDRYDNNRYTVGARAFGTFSPLPHELTDADVLALVHAVAAGLGFPTGYGNIFHVFLPPGTDECFDSTYSQCYSPDIPNTFYYCGYHSSVDFSDIGHVLYSVEPYQDVAGCAVPPGTPNGQLVDSTNNVLSHETFETITDPDGTAWWNIESLSLGGEEIADECEFVISLPYRRLLQSVRIPHRHQKVCRPTRVQQPWPRVRDITR